MRITPSDKIVLIDSNISAQDYPEYDETTAYTTDDKVTVVADDKNYYAIKDIAAGVTPDPTDTKGAKTGWFPQTNKRNLPFDYNNIDVIENDDLISFKYYALNIDTISLFGMQGTELYIKMSDRNTGFVFYEKTTQLIDNLIHPHNYFFVPPSLKDQLILRLEGTELEHKISELVDTLTTQEIVDRYTVHPPLYFNALVEIEIRNPGGIAKLGKYASGTSYDLGASLWGGSQIKKQRYGVRELNVWGSYTFEEGITVNVITVPVVIDNKNQAYVSDILDKYAYQYCLFEGDESQGVPRLTVFGAAEDETYTLNPSKSTFTLKIGSNL